jgi:uncharacterized membrane protein
MTNVLTLSLKQSKRPSFGGLISVWSSHSDHFIVSVCWIGPTLVQLPLQGMHVLVPSPIMVLIVYSRMQKTLGMNATNNAYTVVSVVFFSTYCIFQAPATVLIRQIGPRNFLSAIVLFWGATMIVGHQHLVKSEVLTDRQHRGLALCPPGKLWQVFELFLVSLKLDSIPGVFICSARGTRVSSFRSVTPGFTSLAAWHLGGEVSWHMDSCR